MSPSRPAPHEKIWIDEPDALARASDARWPPEVKAHVEAMIVRGYTVIRGAVPRASCAAAIQSFHDWCAANRQEADSHRDAYGHFPRFVNFHAVSDAVLSLFSDNPLALEVQDACFGYRTQLYTSLFYERGSAQPMH